MTTNTKNTAATGEKQYDNNLRGVLYKNKNRTDAKHPNAKGRICVEGVWYWLSSWTQHTKTSGELYQSLAMTKMTDEEVDKYINNPRQPQQQSAQNNGQGAPAQSQQSRPVEHNTDGSVRSSSEPPVDFDDEIPF